MKIYLAGPMTGIPHFNFPLFMKVATWYREGGHEVFNPAERDNETHGTDISKDNLTGDPKLATKQYGFSLNDALADDLWYICKEADTIVLLPGWEHSKGAQAEHAAARALGLRFIYWQEHETDA